MEFLKSLDTTQLFLIGAVVFLVATGKINLSALLNSLLNKPATPAPTTPVPVPVPVPQPSPLFPNMPPLITNVLSFLLDRLLQAQASGDKETEKAILATMKSCCDNPLPHTH